MSDTTSSIALTIYSLVCYIPARARNILELTFHCLSDEMMVSILGDQEKAKQSLISLKAEHADIITKSNQHQGQIELLQRDSSVS